MEYCELSLWGKAMSGRLIFLLCDGRLHSMNQHWRVTSLYLENLTVCTPFIPRRWSVNNVLVGIGPTAVPGISHHKTTYRPLSLRLPCDWSLSHSASRYKRSEAWSGLELVTNKAVWPVLPPSAYPLPRYLSSPSWNENTIKLLGQWAYRCITTWGVSGYICQVFCGNVRCR